MNLARLGVGGAAFVSAVLNFISATGADGKELSRPTRRVDSVFTHTVDWYNPPPVAFRSRSEISLPYELFHSVPLPHRQEAIAFLGNNAAVAITDAQAAHFTRSIDAKAVVERRIQEATKTLHDIRDRVTREKAYQLMHLDQDEMREQRRTARLSA